MKQRKPTQKAAHKLMVAYFLLKFRGVVIAGVIAAVCAIAMDYTK